MPRVLTALHLHVAHIDDITRSIAICKTLTNLLHIYIVFCKNLQLIIRQWLWVTLRPWETCTLGAHILIRFWREELSLLTHWIPHRIDPGISSVFNRDDVPRSIICTLIKLPSFTADSSRRLAPCFLSSRAFEIGVWSLWRKECEAHSARGAKLKIYLILISIS